MDALTTELQGVLREACKAQQLEDEQNTNAAIDSYYRASCQLAYLVDMQVDKERDVVLAGLLCGLHQQYETRIAVLKARTTVAEEAHWLQLERHSTAPEAQVQHSCQATESYVVRCCDAAHQPDSQEQGLLTALMATGADGTQCRYSTNGTGAEESQDPQSAIELLRMCQRTVSGSLDDVVGLEEVKEELEEAVFLPLQHPYLFKGIRQPARTFLLYGPPGTGKTMLVEKTAAEAEFSLLSISPSMILSKWAGDSEKAISQVFELARTMQPSILFLDEVDSLGQSRDGNTDPGARRLLTELLIQFNKVAEEEGVYIFAATNRMQDCDPALLRRFSRRIAVPLPTQEERQCFFEAMLSRPEVATDLTQHDIQQLAELTHSYSGSDLAAVCRLAAMAPVKELFQQQRQQRKQLRRRKRKRNSNCDILSSANSHDGETELAGQLCTAETTADANPAGPSTSEVQLQLRKLLLADFQSALSKVLPAAVDASAP